jgi:hypothetical protein
MSPDTAAQLGRRIKEHALEQGPTAVDVVLRGGNPSPGQSTMEAISAKGR